MSIPAMRELLSDPARWTTRADARTASGGSTLYDDRYAVCWCLYGALHKVTPRSEWHTVESELQARMPEGLAVSQFNDRCSHDQLMKLLA